MTTAVVQRPEIFSDSLAQVLHQEGNKKTVLGQAFLVGPGLLATCGHVVEAYTSNSQALLIRFPNSGNEYTAREIRLHSKFLRQPDQLVKYDAALISLELELPEKHSPFLPLKFEKHLKNQQTLFAMRYPAHLGVLSTAPTPLIQEGQLLGALLKDDNFHLLHDLGLSPGDSGSPLFDGETVVGIHCGDTASLPGLNLPTTSIRLALFIDALKDLGVSGNHNRIAKQKTEKFQKFSFLSGQNILIAAVCGVMAMILTIGALLGATELQRRKNHTAVGSVEIQFQEKSEPDKGKIQMVLTPQKSSRIYAIFVGPEHSSVLYPAPNALEQLTMTVPIQIDVPDDCQKLAQSGEGKLLIALLKTPFLLLKNDDIVLRDPSAFAILSDKEKTLANLANLEKDGNAIIQEIHEISPAAQNLSVQAP
ncbi:MAG: serine protease [Candidatus Obscuribacterales bacterium]|nr:serine protease [Candidatus Obscuribacterales bacterium]